MVKVGGTGTAETTCWGLGTLGAGGENRCNDGHYSHLNIPDAIDLEYSADSWDVVLSTCCRFSGYFHC